MTVVTITLAADAGRTIDTFQILVDAFRAPDQPTVPSPTALSYSNSTAAKLELFFGGQDMAADNSDPHVVTDGTINFLNILDFSQPPIFFDKLQVWEGFNGELSAVALYDAVLELRADVNDTGWLDVFGQFDYHMNASRGNVIFRGFGGDDVFSGGRGRDVFDDRFGGDTDVFRGGLGNDTAKVGGGVSTLVGGDGVDTLTFEQLAHGSPTGVTFSMKRGAFSTDVAIGASGRAIGFEVVKGTASEDKITGDPAANNINGASGNDQISGSAGDDTLRGGSGDDLLNGNDGADLLIGGLGKDQLRGGAGNDKFAFTFANDSLNSAPDLIADFAQGEDIIDLTGIDADTGTSGNQDFTFIGIDPFSGAAGELRFFQTAARTLIRGDVNGDGTADFTIVAKGVIAFDGTDFA